MHRLERATVARCLVRLAPATVATNQRPPSEALNIAVRSTTSGSQSVETNGAAEIRPPGATRYRLGSKPSAHWQRPQPLDADRRHRALAGALPTPP